MIKIIVYILLFSLSTMIVYTWGLIKSQNSQKDLLLLLYSKGQRKVIKELRKNKSMTKLEIQEILKNLKASFFYSRSKAVITESKAFTDTLIKTMLEKEIIKYVDEKGKRRYFLNE